jgi:hypothetical protein
VRKLQEEMYQQLLVLRENLSSTIEAALESPASLTEELKPAQSSGTVTMDAEEHKKLVDENTRLKYRVKILLDTISILESNQK